MRFEGTTTSLDNCIFSGNSATNAGAIGSSGSLSLTNSTLSLNAATNEGGALTNFGGPCAITNCIFDGNAASIAPGISGSATVSYSIGQLGGAPGDGNLDGLDPLLADPDGPDNMVGTEDDDLRLADLSPAIDAGDNNATNVPGFTLDIAGNPRFFDNPIAPDTGNGTAPLIDMGAHEWTEPVAVAFCPCERNDDGITNVLDLLHFLDSWFEESTGSGTGLADQNGDGTVNVLDLLDFLTCWFPTARGIPCI